MPARLVGTLLIAAMMPFAPACDRANDQAPHQSAEARLTFYGGVERVSGSLALLNARGHNWMIDCGAFYGDSGQIPDRAAEAVRATSHVPVAVDTIDAILITHAHLDHAGRLPVLHRAGYRGPIYATRMTRNRLRPMLEMIVRNDDTRDREWLWSAQRESGGYATAHWMASCDHGKGVSRTDRETLTGTRSELAAAFLRRGADVSACKLCASLEVAPIIDRVRFLSYDAELQLADGVTVTALDAGHIPGSASFLINIREGSKSLRVLFSGDVGNPHSSLIAGPKPLPPVDVLVVEATYGCRHRTTDTPEELAHFRRQLADVIAAGGIAWVPAFALDRTQKVLHQIRIAQRENLLPAALPILVTSSTAMEVSTVYEESREVGGFRQPWLEDRRNLYPEGLEFVRGVPVDVPGGTIVISTSSSLAEAASAKLLDQLIERDDVTIFLVGYQMVDSPGGEVNAARHAPPGTASVITADGAMRKIRARIIRVGGMSAHARADELDAWMAGLDRATTEVLLVHGDTGALTARQSCLVQAKWERVRIPRFGQTFSFALRPE